LIFRVKIDFCGRYEDANVLIFKLTESQFESVKLWNRLPPMDFLINRVDSRAVHPTDYIGFRVCR